MFGSPAYREGRAKVEVRFVSVNSKEYKSAVENSDIADVKHCDDCGCGHDKRINLLKPKQVYHKFYRLE
jgi:hypothetical protein